MSFLLDTNICSAHVRRPVGLAHRFMQHSGRLFIPTIVFGELHAWAHRRQNRDKLLRAIDEDLLQDVKLLDYDRQSAAVFGALRATLLNQGVVVNAVDVMIAAVALQHDLTMVTHNTRDFENVPDLRIEDWLAS